MGAIVRVRVLVTRTLCVLVEYSFIALLFCIMYLMYCILLGDSCPESRVPRVRLSRTSTRVHKIIVLYRYEYEYEYTISKSKRRKEAKKKDNEYNKRS